MQIDSVPGDGMRVMLLSPLRNGHSEDAAEPHADENDLDCADAGTLRRGPTGR